MFQKIQLGFQAFFSWVLGFVLSIFPFWLLIVALCFYDRHVGIKAAVERDEKLNKNGWRRTIDKIGVYTGWILLGGVFQFVFHDDIPPSVSIAKLLAGMICFTEFDSIVFNISDYTGRDYRKLLLQRIPFIGGWIAERISRDKSRFLAIHKLETENDDAKN
jgi:hypothetical protein